MFKIRLTGGKLTKEDWRKAIIAGILSLGLFSMADAQNWVETKRDTIIPVQFKVTQNQDSYKANWCGRAVNISKKDGAAIMNGDTAAIVMVYYKVEGQVVIKPLKAIALNYRKNGNTK